MTRISNKPRTSGAASSSKITPAARPALGGPVSRLPVSLARACALWCVVSLTGISVFAQQPPPRPPARAGITCQRPRRIHAEGARPARRQSPDARPVHPRRDRDVRNPRPGPLAAAPHHGATTRGTSATACTSAARCGSTGSRSARRRATQYETNWIRRERARQERKAEERERGEKKESGEIAITGEGIQISTGGPAVTEPRFVSEAYFMDFKFEPGNYYLAGREKLEGQEVAEGRVLPHQDVRRLRRRERRAAAEGAEGEESEKPADARRTRRQREKEKAFEQDIERRMNKTALVTLWVDPAEHQIVKYTFDNVWLDFLPAGWLVQVDDMRASMTMCQPFAGRVAAARHRHPCRRHARQRLVRGVRTSARSPSTGWRKSRRRCGCRRRRMRNWSGLTTTARSSPRVSPSDRGQTRRQTGVRARVSDPAAWRGHRRDPHSRQRLSDGQGGLELRRHRGRGAARGRRRRDDHPRASKDSGKFETVDVRKRYRSLTAPPTSRSSSSCTRNRECARRSAGPTSRRAGRGRATGRTAAQQADVPADRQLRRRLRLHLRRTRQHRGSARHRTSACRSR